MGCDGPHTTDACQQNIEIVAFIKNDPHSNNYNPCWRNCPNFGWGWLSQQQGSHCGGVRCEAFGYHHEHHNALSHNPLPPQNQANTASFSSSTMENLFREYM